MMNVLNNKQGKISKTKVGIALIALVPVLETLGGILLGDISFISGLTKLITLSGAVFAAFGIRDIFKK